LILGLAHILLTLIYMGIKHIINTAFKTFATGLLVVSASAFAQHAKPAPKAPAKAAPKAAPAKPKVVRVISRGALREVLAYGQHGEIILKAVKGKYSQDVTYRNHVILVVPELNGFVTGKNVIYRGSLRTIQAIGEDGTLVLASTKVHRTQDFTYITQADPIVDTAGDLKKGDKVHFQGQIRDVEAVSKQGMVILQKNKSFPQATVGNYSVSKLTVLE